jgi:hypothetical protein
MKNKNQKPSKFTKRSSKNPIELVRVLPKEKKEEEGPTSKISKKKKRGKAKKECDQN